MLDVSSNPLLINQSFQPGQPKLAITRIAGIEQTIGKTIVAPDGKRYSVIGVSISIPETSTTKSFTKNYGDTASDFLKTVLYIHANMIHQSYPGLVLLETI